MVIIMAKFRNKKTKKIVEEHLNFYIEKLRNNPNFEEIKEKKKATDNNQEVENGNLQENESQNEGER